MPKDILLMLSTFPDPTAGVALKPVVQFARRNDSFISGLALEIDIHEPSSLLPSWIIDVRNQNRIYQRLGCQPSDRHSTGQGADRRHTCRVPTTDGVCQGNRNGSSAI